MEKKNINKKNDGGCYLALYENDTNDTYTCENK